MSRSDSVYLLSGTVEYLSIKEGMHDFTLPAARTTQAVTRSLVTFLMFKAIATGSAVAGIRPSILKPQKRKVVFVDATINGVFVHGVFSSLGIKVGDQVECVLCQHPGDESPTVYAIRCPANKKIWIHSKVTRGQEIGRDTHKGIMFFYIKYIMPFVAVMALLLFLFIEGWSIFADPLFLLMIFGGILGFIPLAGLVVFVGPYLFELPDLLFANRVLSALGYQHPKQTSLRWNSEYLKGKWEQTKGQPYPVGPDDGICYYYSDDDFTRPSADLDDEMDEMEEMFRKKRDLEWAEETRQFKETRLREKEQRMQKKEAKKREKEAKKREKEARKREEAKKREEAQRR